MLGFEVTRNGERLCVAAGGTLALIVSRMARDGREAAHLDVAATFDDGRQVSWVDDALSVDDVLAVRVVEAEPSEPGPPGLPRFTPRAEGSIGFEVTIGAEKVRAGTEGPGVLVLAMTTLPLGVSVTASSDTDYMAWLDNRPLSAGDELEIRITRSTEWDLPSSVKRWQRSTTGGG